MMKLQSEEVSRSKRSGLGKPNAGSQTEYQSNKFRIAEIDTSNE